MRFVVLVLVSMMMTGCVTKYVMIPSDMTQPFDALSPKDQSLDEAVNLANKRGEIIEQCNMRLIEISEIQGTEVP